MMHEDLDELYKISLHYIRPKPSIGAAPPRFRARPLYFRHTPLGAVFRVRMDKEKRVRQDFVAPHLGARISPLFPPYIQPLGLSLDWGFV